MDTSCILDKEIRVFHLDWQFLSHPGPDKNHVHLMHRLYWKSHIYVVKWCSFYRRYVKNDIFLCKLDINIKNRMVVDGSVDVFKLE